MLRLPQSEDAEDFSSDVASTSFETSVGPSRSHRTSKTRRWRPFIYIAVLLIIIIFIIRAFRSSGNNFYGGHTFGDSGPAILRQASKVRAPNFHKTNPRGDYRKRMLCKLLGNGKCQSKYIADVIDLVWVLGPLYCFDKDSDWKLFEMHGYFKGYMESYGLNFITIEAIRFPGDEHLRPWSKECREYTATIPGNEPYDIQTHYYNVSFIRENLLNVAIRKLEQQKPWEYAFWIDAHHMFYNNYWWEESIYKLEKFNSVQLVETVQYVGYDNVTKYPFKTLGIIKASLLSDFPFNYTIFFGNAFGIRRDIYHAIGTIYDECIATSCDCAYTLASFPDGVGFPPLYPVYYKNFEPWINHTKSVFQGKRAFVTGNALHLPHGHGFPYGEVQDSVVKNNYNTTLHITRDENFTFIITNSTISAELDEIILTSKREHPTSRW